ncbi:hypothetical protein [Actinopolymorpha alba]|uniref:hypothetical protein n=1 Tax=Actinopolymorpha alba TaxID=533267 RepID=UPI00146D9EEB|nr:hypothetical protein [Actinopolymorpha alba]
MSVGSGNGGSESVGVGNGRVGSGNGNGGPVFVGVGVGVGVGVAVGVGVGAEVVGLGVGLGLVVRLGVGVGVVGADVGLGLVVRLGVGAGVVGADVGLGLVVRLCVGVGAGSVGTGAARVGPGSVGSGSVGTGAGEEVGRGAGAMSRRCVGAGVRPVESGPKNAARGEGLAGGLVTAMPVGDGPAAGVPGVSLVAPETRADGEVGAGFEESSPGDGVTTELGRTTLAAICPRPPSTGVVPKRYQPAVVAAVPTASTLAATPAITSPRRGRRWRPGGSCGLCSWTEPSSTGRLSNGMRTPWCCALRQTWRAARWVVPAPVEGPKPTQP